MAIDPSTHRPENVPEHVGPEYPVVPVIVTAQRSPIYSRLSGRDISGLLSNGMPNQSAGATKVFANMEAITSMVFIVRRHSDNAPTGLFVLLQNGSLLRVTGQQFQTDMAEVSVS